MGTRKPTTPATANWGPNPKRSKEITAQAMRNATWIITNSDGRSFRFARIRCSPRVSPPLSRRRWLDRSARGSNGRLTRSRRVCDRRLLGPGSRISAPSADWARLGSASASDARRTPIAATADTRMIPGTSGTTARRGVRLEDRRRKEFGPLREVIHVYGHVAQGGVEADGVAVIVDPKLAILDQLLRLRLAVAQTGDLADAHDLARSSSHPLGLNDHVHRRSDLLLDCARR